MGQGRRFICFSSARLPRSFRENASLGLAHTAKRMDLEHYRIGMDDGRILSAVKRQERTLSAS